MDYVKKNFLFWPVFWLALGCAALGFLPAAAAGPPALARLSIVSGLLYAGAYLLIGVATDVRYYYWPILSIMTGMILAFPDMRSRWRTHPGRAMAAAACILAVLAGGYAARLADVHFV